MGLPLSVFAPLAMAPVAAAVGVMLLIGAIGREGAIARPSPVLVFAFTAFWLWAAVTLLWTIAPADGMITAARLVGLFACAFVLTGAADRLDERDRRMIARALLFGVVLGLVLVLVDMHTHNLLTRWLKGGRSFDMPPDFYRAKPDRAATVLVLSLWATLGLLIASKRRLLAVGLLLLAAAAIFSSVSLSAKVAFVSGTVAGALALRWPRAVERLMAVAIVVSVALAPFAAHRLPDAQTLWEMRLPIPNSTHHRLVIWRFAGDRIAEHPMLGWGLEASRAMPGGQDVITVTRRNPRTERIEPLSEPLMPLHPHNGILQVWLELGAPGAALLVLLSLLLLRLTRTLRHAISRAAGLAVFTAAFAVFCVSYGAWQSWWLATLCLTAALCPVLDAGATGASGMAGLRAKPAHPPS